MGYVPVGLSKVSEPFEVGIRSQRASAQVVPMPFYKRPT
jgi:glycine cleavage system aminomethyltransferase T